MHRGPPEHCRPGKTPGGLDIDTVVSGGGTGGHVYPAVALAKYLQGRSDKSVLFMGSNSGIEAAEADKAGLSFRGLDLKGVAGRRPLGMARSLCMFLVALHRCRKLFKKERPAVVIGTGGYAAAPSCFAALTCDVPLVLHEMNYYPGLVTRALSRRADVVSTAYSGTSAYLSGKSRVVLTGVPVREEIAALREDSIREDVRSEALAHFNLVPGNPTLLVFGGSQGAKALNQAVLDMMDEIAAVPAVQVLHITGRRRSDESAGGAGEMPAGGGRYVAMEYCHRMELAYAAADLALCRAGAGTLAELKAATVPAVMVPYPYASRGHQEMNAAEFEKHGAAIVVLQEGHSAARAAGEALRLLQSPDELNRMREAMRRMPGTNGSEGIAAIVEELRTRAERDRAGGW